MMIRAATLADRDPIIAIGRRMSHHFPKLRFDADRARAGLTLAISSAAHFIEVVEREEEVRGVLIGLTGNNLWAQRKNCDVVFWTSEVPGTGATLLRHFRDWVRSRRAIKVAGFCPALDLDASVLALMERVGFEKHGGSWLLYN